MRRARAVLLAVGLVASVLAVLWEAGLFDPGRASRGFRNVGMFVAELLPPDTSPTLLSTLLRALWETVQMAWAGTLIGAALALPLAALAAANLAPWWVARPTRALLAGIRTIPSILWAVMMIIIVGFGARAGILALALYTTGYLGKLFYEAIEAVDPEVLDATRATGARPLHVARHAAIPEAGNALLSQTLFAFEYNVRASSILGLVGAGGIGFYMLRAIDLIRYQELATILVMLFVLVIAVDAASGAVRNRFLAR